jgi:Trm5-related predicted tRNA methylase
VGTSFFEKNIIRYSIKRMGVCRLKVYNRHNKVREELKRYMALRRVESRGEQSILKMELRR